MRRFLSVIGLPVLAVLLAGSPPVSREPGLAAVPTVGTAAEAPLGVQGSGVEQVALPQRARVGRHQELPAAALPCGGPAPLAEAPIQPQLRPGAHEPAVASDRARPFFPRAPPSPA